MLGLGLGLNKNNFLGGVQFTRLSSPITYGNYLVGGSGIVVTDGIYNKTPDAISYQWKRAGSNISGATTNIYTPLLTDENLAITCLVSATYGTETLTYETPAFTLKAGLLFNTASNSLTFAANQTTGDDWTVKTRFDRKLGNIALGSVSSFFLLHLSGSTGLVFEGQNIRLISKGITYSSNITSGSMQDVRNFINGNHTWEFIKVGTTLTCNVNGQFLTSFSVAVDSSLSYRRIGRWTNSTAYDFRGVLDYIEIDGVRYDSLNNWGGLAQAGVTKTQIYYGEMEDSFVVSGQSNAVARNNQADNAYLGITFPIEKSKYFNDVASNFQSTIFGVNQGSDFAGNWGVEFRNAYNLSQVNRQNYLFKYAIGGTSMASLWLNASWSILGMKMAKSGRAFKNFLWIQGESDAGNLALANAYQDNLTEFIRRVRMYSTYGDDMKFIIFRLPNITRPEYLYVSTIQAAQDYVAANVPNVEIVTAPDNWNAPDGEHYDAPTIDAIAQRMYNELQLREI